MNDISIKDLASKERLKEDAQFAKELYNSQSEEFSKKQTEYCVLQDFRSSLYRDHLTNIETKKILFAGSGDGRECIPATIMGAKVIGVDISEKLVELSQKNCPQADFFVMDIERMAFENAFFDVVVSFFVVMYKEDLQAVLQEFRRVLKDDGMIIIAVPHPVRRMMKYNNFCYFVKGKKYDTWKGVTRFGYNRLFEDYIDAFVKSGLKLIQLVEPKPIKESLDTLDQEINYPHFLLFKLMKA